MATTVIRGGKLFVLSEASREDAFPCTPRIIDGTTSLKFTNNQMECTEYYPAKEAPSSKENEEAPFSMRLKKIGDFVSNETGIGVPFNRPSGEPEEIPISI